MAAAATKVCSKCEVEKPLAEFPVRQTSRDGRHCWCHACKKAYYAQKSREWREKNRERDCQNQRNRRKDPENLKKLREWMREYRAANREHVRALERARQAREYATPEGKARIQEHKRRRALGISEASPEVTARVAEIYTEPCVYCGATNRIEVDHIIPLSRGGKHELDNLAPACRSCNASKRDKLLSEWEGMAA